MDFNTIVISGLPGSGKSILLRELSKRYKWDSYSIGDMWRARHSTLHPNNDISFQDFWASTTPEDNKRINEEARKIIEKGNSIWDSRYSVAYTRDIPVLQVFLHANLDVRSQRAVETAKYPNKTVEEVAEILTKREQDELTMGQKLYGSNFDYRDPKLYHLKLDSSKMTLEEEIIQINERMNGSSFQSVPISATQSPRSLPFQPLVH